MLKISYHNSYQCFMLIKVLSLLLLLFRLMKKRKILLCVLLLLNCIAAIEAQEIIPAAGGNASGNGGMVSYSLGQVVYTTNTGGNGSVSQGVQQVFVSVITNTKEKRISLELSTYPNPTSDLLVLNAENYNNPSLAYQLYDMQGNVMATEKLTNETTFIEMAKLSSGVYLLRITDAEKQVKTIKVIKK